MASKIPNNKNLLFAYGSLITGCGIATIDRIMARAQVIGRGFVRGRLYDLGHYPAAVLTKSVDESISGVVYRVPATAWPKLDAYEGANQITARDSEFVRQRVTVYGVDSVPTLPCWMYVYNGQGPKKLPIPGGDYVAYRQRQSGTRRR